MRIHNSGNAQYSQAFWNLFVVTLVCFGLLPSKVLAENYAFLVAVQDYDVKDLKPLNYTRNDITDFATLLRESGFKDQNIVLMTDKADNRRFLAESERIRKQFNLLLATLTDGDTLVVAFSGHGVQFEGDAKNYYCPADADLDDPKHAKLIAISEIYDRLKECPAEKKLLFVDACRNDPMSSVKKSRDTVRLKSVTRPQTEAVPKGVVALFSCSSGQESYEWPDLKHGIFFHHVLEGWRGKAADEQRQVTLNGLVNYTTQQTQAFARVKLDALQSPQLKSDFEGTWVLRRMPAIAKSEYQSLFNGRDFTGWEGLSQYWSIEDGAIVGRAPGKDSQPLKFNTYLVWQGGNVEDFELQFSCRVDAGNTGVQFRSRLTNPEKFIVGGYQTDIAVIGKQSRYIGGLYEELGRGVLAERGTQVRIDQSGKKSTPVSFADATELLKVYRDRDWNDYVIVARGNRLTQYINTKPFADVIDEQTEKRAGSGIIALQLHSGETVARFRNIRLKRLSKSL